ncbi:MULTISPECIES: hypothetical protein [unclassified Blastococcus]|jgi:uncharacterized membrane protein YwzB|uniref:hypothetical protein n=1 Tax=unclassified Blastococcus TaxID=2619396 RepID=UPI000DE9F024|nr:MULTISPECIES: hypothetical protein [unclassified Blastococcus]MBN1092131.1 hypothetical protein [Blastococcus sp. TML/M2B]MBN1097763.1 hypothetical protein [Blastococcus sp. TML/C7B]RBY91224.1 hypothetical protein DQ241_06060 [Blastococcus sp. TF02A-30]
MFQPTIRRGAQAVVAQCVIALSVVFLSVLAWLRAEKVADDRGSDSSEKAFMVILAIALGGAVSAAAIAFVASKTSLFQ